MRKLIFSTSVVATVVLSSSAFAGKDDHLIVQEAAKNVVNVQQITKLKDETGVTLTGQITKHIKSDHYEFKDTTGVISLEIDDDLWRAVGLKVGDHVRDRKSVV